MLSHLTPKLKFFQFHSSGPIDPDSFIVVQNTTRKMILSLRSQNMSSEDLAMKYLYEI